MTSAMGGLKVGMRHFGVVFARRMCIQLAVAVLFVLMIAGTGAAERNLGWVSEPTFSFSNVR